jgi:exportin-1
VSTVTFPHIYSTNALPAQSYRAQIDACVAKLCDSCNDITRFKVVLRDFLIQLKEFSGDDNAELFLEEKEAEAQKKAEAEREAAMKVPGMLKPSQLEDEEL